PSGDQSGYPSSAASKVNRVGTPRTASMSQTSLLRSSVRYSAIRFPSGDSSTSLKPVLSAAPMVPVFLPDRSSQVSCRVVLTDAALYATMPEVAENPGANLASLLGNCSATFSATENGSPESSCRLKSKL